MNAFLSIAALLFLPGIAADVQPSNGKLAPFFDPQQAAIKIDVSGLHLDLRGRALATDKKHDEIAAPKKNKKAAPTEKGGKKVSVANGKKGVSNGKKGADGKKSKGKKSVAGVPTDQDISVPPPDISVPQPEDDELSPPPPPQEEDGLPPQEDGGPTPPPPNFETEFAMIRSQVGSPDGVGELRLASSIGVNGFITKLIYNADGGTTHGQEAIGQFKGACTLISEVAGVLMCTYEIALTRNQTGVIITTGQVSGEENKALVTGAEFDFAGYTGGVLTTRQDPELPVMYSHLSLF